MSRPYRTKWILLKQQIGFYRDISIGRALTWIDEFISLLTFGCIYPGFGLIWLVACLDRRVEEIKKLEREWKKEENNGTKSN